MLGSGSRTGDRIESLLRGRSSSPVASLERVSVGVAMLIVLAMTAARFPNWIAFAQTSRPQFEVTSVKTNTACDADAETEKFSAGRLTVTCIKLSNLIQAAWSRFADGKSGGGPRLDIVGAPAWMQSSRFDISATARGDTPMEEMFGPMLRTLLEERFHLQIHREIRELPVYALTALKSGPKLKAWQEGDCAPVDLKHSNDPSPNFCGMRARADGLHVVDEARGMTMTEIAERMLANRLDRPVIDRTGLAGRFNAHLEFDRDSAASAGLSIFTAVEDQLGIKLEASTGPVPILVIDHLEHPDAN
jgi:uncharacterized protein (TIGR03435 family)